jgi:hypothetical protein
MDKVGEQLPAVGITAASLTLVFLGFLISSWEGFPTTALDSIRPRYRRRARLAFAGIVFSLLSVVLGFLGMETAHQWPGVDWAGAICLAVWAVLTLTQAGIALKDFK